MRRNIVVSILFIMFIIILLFTGCAMSVHDKLPSGVSKGYVEFYGEGVTEIDNYATWYITKYENGRETKYDIVIWDGNTKRRIAERPGMHTFIVRMGSAAHKVSVEILEGMIVPVKVVIKEGKTEYSYKRKTYYFDLSSSVEKAIPFVK